MQRWCCACCGEDYHKQAAETGRKQKDSNCGPQYWHSEPAPCLLIQLTGNKPSSPLQRTCTNTFIFLIAQVSAGLVPDGRHLVSRARDEASSWRRIYKGPIPTSALASRLGSYVQAYTLYSSVRPFGVTAIVGGWDSEAELPVDGQVGSGPKSGAGGKVEGAKAGGPGLYMIEPSGLYWVRQSVIIAGKVLTSFHRGTTVPLPVKGDKPQKQNLRNWI